MSSYDYATFMVTYSASLGYQKKRPPKETLHQSRSTKTTPRLTQFYREAGSPDKPTLVLLHGNVSSSVFYEPLLAALKDDFHLIAPDLRGYGKTEQVPIDATGGVKVWSDDLKELFDALELKPSALLGWSLGGGVALQYAIDHPEDLTKLIVINPLPPRGFSGTHGPEASINNEEFSGTGGAIFNPTVIENLKNKVADPEVQFSAPQVLKGYFAPTYELDPELQAQFVEGMFDMALGDDFYPGSNAPSTQWPFVGPGDKGVNNTMSPKYVDLTPLANNKIKPPIWWLRGGLDTIVSDTSYGDVGFLGQLGILPGWPGADVYPPQPMVSQTRHLFDQYQAGGGEVQETVYEASGHGPHLEEMDRFVKDLKDFLG